MKIAVTGTGHSLGKNICEVLGESHTIVHLTGKVETYQDTILDEVKDCDVFVNCGYKDRIQSALFRKVYLDWKYKEKTIVNILTSALMFGSPNKKYVDDKLDLEKLSKEVRCLNKKVRIVNIYPNTLENTQINIEKLSFSQVSEVIKYAIELPHSIELFSLGISKTTLEMRRSIL